MSSYRTSHLHQGADYHASFDAIPRRKMMWNIERELLPYLLAEELPAGGIEHLDFACGTGRILGFLRPYVSTSTGVDLSPSMLEQAQANAPEAQLHLGDLTRDDTLVPGPFHLITAFRFFPNAEPALRVEVMGALAQRLAPGGVLLFNNHMHTGSTARRLRSALGRAPGPQMAAEEIEPLVASHGLRIHRRVPAGLLPFTDRFMLRPTGLFATLERQFSRLESWWPFADNVLYVCKKATI